MRDSRSFVHSPLLPGDSPAWRELLDSLRSVAPSRLPVLIQGESGSGKDGVARAVHTWSLRSEGPFVAVNCASLNESLLEAELFGAVRGAYTGCERDRPGLLGQADRGTLFLDEVGEMSAALQGKLLRFLDNGGFRPVGATCERSSDVRIVAATHRDLHRATATGRFRPDLWWRLAVIRIDVPPLRYRLTDLPLIVDRLAPGLERECGRGPLALTDAAWSRLAEHPWPGNVRELRSVLARALLSTGELPLRARTIRLDRPAHAAGDEARTLEERMIRDALASAAGHIGHAAARIGWSRQKLYRRMEALGLRTTQSTRRDLEPTTSSASSTFQ
ncbi:MAG: hypothetical protein GTN89_03735 [Acidobacteria bacterium]|nr:hypothetical protein [Acidobacteriota bacterium]NIM63573.1 hypothetical protein [Acidobacteriota bacterium]NIO58435.1 hypothetical protein [Acidobacteriota bacterium]NIQ29490.1 hypothetical protein [Acidobacteriota bacterium]NIQ84167.1 hypothetical protein [Acidobacteriota bacterium]